MINPIPLGVFVAEVPGRPNRIIPVASTREARRIFDQLEPILRTPASSLDGILAADAAWIGQSEVGFD
jgi:hypothetical protein